jgi:hypothetical protein
MPATDESPLPGEEQHRQRLTADFHAQTALIPFAELQRFFAAGRLVHVAAKLDLVEVAVELALDKRERFEAWLAAGAVEGVSDGLAARWLAEERSLWAVVAEPWVLVQERASD